VGYITDPCWGNIAVNGEKIQYVSVLYTYVNTLYSRGKDGCQPIDAYVNTFQLMGKDELRPIDAYVNTLQSMGKYGEKLAFQKQLEMWPKHFVL
jgi:hypothetical protein